MASLRATGSRTVCPLVGLLAVAVWCAHSGAAELFRDDFSGFPPGWLTRPVGQLNAAIQEYHYLPHRGVPLGPWANAICHLDAWAVGEEDGRSYLEQHTVNDQARLMNPIFLTGDPEWEDYDVEVGVRPLSLDDMAGVVFRYHTNRHYYLFALTEFRQPQLLEHTISFVEQGKVRQQDYPRFFGALLSNSAARDLTWKYLKAHWEDLAQKVTTFGGAGAVSALGSACSQDMRDDVTQFFATHRAPGAQHISANPVADLPVEEDQGGVHGLGDQGAGRVDQLP